MRMERMIQKTTFEDYSVHTLKTLYVSFIAKEAFNEDKLLKAGNPDLNPLKYSKDVSSNFIKSSHVYHKLIDQTLSFGKEDVVCSAESSGKPSEVIIRLNKVTLIKDKEFDLHLKFNLDLEACSSTENIEAYRVKIMKSTKIILCDRVEIGNNNFRLSYLSPHDIMRLELVQTGPLLHDFLFKSTKHTSIRSSLSFLGDFLTDGRKNNNNTALLPLLLTAPTGSELSSVIREYARHCEIPLLEISAVDIMKRNCLVAEEMEDFFQSIINLTTSLGDYSVLLLDDLHELCPSLRKEKKISNSKPLLGAIEIPQLTYEERSYHLFKTTFIKFLQMYEKTLPNLLSFTHKVSIIGIISDEDDLHKSVLPLFPLKSDLRPILQLSQKQLFAFICELYDINDINYEDFEFKKSDSKLLQGGKKEDQFIPRTFLLGPTLRYFDPETSSSSSSSSNSLRFDSCFNALSDFGIVFRINNPVIFQEKGLRQVNRLLYGIEEIMKEFEELILWPVKFQHLYQAYGIISDKAHSQVTKHAILYGPSGCGKSSIPSFLAKKFGYNLLQSNIASLMKGSIGGTEEELVKLFQKAKKQSPCFLVLDELTSIFRKDEHSENSGDSSAERTIFSTLLSCFDDVNSWNLYNSTHKGSEDHSRERNIIVIGITREPWLLPSRLMSYGRFQRSIFVDILSDTGRENFLREEICSMTPRGGNEELLMELVKLTDGFSGADLQYLMKKLAHCLQKAEKDGNHNQLEKNMIEMTRGRTPSISKSMREKFKTWKR